MHIPAYAHETIRAAVVLKVPTSRQVGGLDCCLCDKPFGQDLAAVPLGPTPTSGLFGCRPCLTRLVTRTRRGRDATLIHDAERARAESASWVPVRDHHVARLISVREAAEAVAGLARSGDTEALRVAWLLISLESAYTWVADAPEPPASIRREDPKFKDEVFRLDLAMIKAREAVAERLAYHLVNDQLPEEPEKCDEFECPESCSGRHETSHIDSGPDAIFDDLAEHGISVELPKHDPRTSRLISPFGQTEAERNRSPLSDIEEQAPVVLKHSGIDSDDTDVLVSAAAVGLVADAWRDGPLDAIHADDDGPNDGEIFAQSVDLYRRARAALIVARDDGPEALLAFVAVASDLDLPWAGGSRFALRSMPEFASEFVQHVNDQVWLTMKVMRERGWRGGLLHRAVSAASKAPTYFGMPAWPSVVASAMERLAPLDRSHAPDSLTDLATVETLLLEAPDQLGADALNWLSHQALLGWCAS
ncbi:hypothetical protein ACFYUR_03080 [Micromonospora haikouensis]|uniref:hypothetical protein n=1 Tax=Micromonospora haikouensis TaxID=686309 RepID=UPI0036C844E7